MTYLPATQGKHAEEPLLAATEPLGQGEHTPALGKEKVPKGHNEQELELLPP